MGTRIVCLVMIASLAAGLALAAPARPHRREGDLKVGDKAPDFTLKLLGSDKKLTLSSNFGKQPTALIFASYT